MIHILQIYHLYLYLLYISYMLIISSLCSVVKQILALFRTFLYIFFVFLFIFCFAIKQSAVFAKNTLFFGIPDYFLAIFNLFSRLFLSIFQSVFFQICLFHSSFSLGRILVSNSLLHNFLLINRVKDVWEVSLCAMEINS